MNKNTMGAYMSVEAALVIPMAICVILLCLYLMLYRYDLCLTYLDSSVLAMECAINSINEDGRISKIHCMENYENQLYISCREEDTQISKENNCIRVTTRKDFIFPFAGFSVLDMIKENWEIEVCEVLSYSNPVKILKNIRFFKKVTGENGEYTDGEEKIGAN